MQMFFVHESNINNGPEVRGGLCGFRFWKHLEHSFIPRRWYFFVFFSAPFSRRRSLVDDCFTGQSPGSAIFIPAAPDVHEALGQIQASAP